MSRKKNIKRGKQSRAGIWSVSIIVLALVLIISYRCIELYDKNLNYEAQEDKLETQLEDEQTRQEEISDYQEYVGTDEYVEDVARAKLGLVNKGEIVFKESGQ